MTPREIIAEAWAITKRERQLRGWGIFSSFFESLLNLKLILYQLYFAYAYFVTRHSVGFFDDVIWLYAHVAAWVFYTIIISFLLLLAVEWLVPNLALGAIIGLSAKSHCGEKVEGGFILALYNFFPIFALHEILFLSGWAMTITLCSLVLRYVNGEIKWFMVGTIVFFWILTNILKFFFGFAQPAVVVNKKGIFEAMGQSFKLIISHLGHVMFLLVLLVVISLRVAVNAAVVVLIPGIVIGIGFLLALIVSPMIAYSIAGVVGLALVVLAGYFFGYLHAFKEAVWTITYIELSKRRELDVISA